MNKYWAHFKTICKHKAAVFHHCRKCGILWQGITHDLSKFSPSEFLTSAKYFQGDRSPIEAEKEAIGYSNAWLHHKGHNKHHWEYWCDFEKNGVPFPHRIPYKYIIEMICDWIGAGQVYDSDEWTCAVPWNYYWGVRGDRHFHEDTEKLIVKFLEIIRDDGLDKFYYCAREGFNNLKKMQKRRKNQVQIKWIPTSIAFPEEYKYVLTSYYDKELDLRGVNIAFYADGKWCLGSGYEPQDYPINAWAELPESYKE